MDRETARAYLNKIEFYADKEGIDGLLEAVDKAQADHPTLTEAGILLGMDIDDNDEWFFDPELSEDPEWKDML